MEKMDSIGQQGQASSPDLPSWIQQLLPSWVIALMAWTLTRVAEIIREENAKLLSEHRQMQPLMSLTEVAEVLGVSKRTVEDIISSGNLEPIWVRGQRRFHPQSVAAYMRSDARGKSS